MLKELRKKIEKKIIERHAKPYFSTFYDYLAYIKEQSSAGEVRIEYIFNILGDVGYLQMIGAELPVKPIKEIQAILTSEGPFAGKGVPDLIDFDDLSHKMNTYTRSSDSFRSPPQLDNITEEEAWEDMWRDERDRGIELLSAGLEMVAVMLGHELVLKNVDWGNGFRNAFENKAKEYLTKLSENKKYFYHLSDDVLPYLIEFPHMPECPFHYLLVDIVSPRETYVKEKHYRQIISPEEADEIFYKVSEKFEQCSSTAEVYFYEHALAQEVLRGFVSKICSAKERLSPEELGPWRFVTTLDEEFDCEVPMISAGGMNYSVHMLDTPNLRVSGWGMRKDRLRPFLSETCREFQGALFCSWKEYPTEEILVRFDNYIKKDRLTSLLEEKDEMFKDFVELTLEDVYKYQLRDEFLEEAATAAMEIPVDHRALLFVLSQYEQEKLKEQLMLADMKTLDMLLSSAAIFQYLRARTPVRVMGAALPSPESNIIFIPRTFPAEGVEGEVFFDPWSGVDDLSRLIELAGWEGWHFITLFAHSEREITLDKKKNPELFKKEGRISKDVPAGTTIAGFVVGPKDKVIQVRDSFDQFGEVTDEQLKDIYWIFYGPGKDKEND